MTYLYNIYYMVYGLDLYKSKESQYIYLRDCQYF